jgi:hypothetical protein
MPSKLTAPSMVGKSSIITKIDGEIVTVVIEGFSSTEDFEAHFASLRMTFAKFRRCGLPVRMMVDLRAAAVISPDALAEVAAFHNTIFGPADRMAMVVQSELIRMQLRRAIDPKSSSAFGSLCDAIAWLKNA